MTTKNKVAMKKILFMMSLCALAFASCQKPEIEEVATPEGQYTYTLVGTASPEVKASVGDKVDNKWPMLWEAGDKIGVYSADGATLIGVAEIAAEDAGSNMAKFTLTTNQELTAGQALSIVYPYVEGAAAAVPTKQSLAAANSSAGVGANAVATATATFAGADTAFELNYSNAYLRFVLNSSEFKDYTLNGITLWADGTELSAEDYVKVTLSEPAVLGEGNNVVWMTANPVDLTGKKVWAIVHMTKGIETVTLPVELKGAANLPANAVTNVTLPALTASLAPAWYEPIETRYIAAYGEGWSYGSQNTVLFKVSEEAQTVDLKARGNFMEVKEPKYVQIFFASSISEKHADFPTAVKIDGVDSYSGAYDIFEVGDDHAVSVSMKKYNSGRPGYFSTMFVMDADKNPIWGINLWLAVDGIADIQYTNGKVMNHNLGATFTASKDGTWPAGGGYFQWGRPWGFQWSTNNAYNRKYAENKNVTSLAVSAATPFTLYYYTDVATYGNNWYFGRFKNDVIDDLWGNPNSSNGNAGVKSIYDPCPEGYMVMSPALADEVASNYKVDDSKTLFTLNYNNGADKWGLSGGFYCTNKSGGRTSTNTNYVAAYWTNSVSGVDGRCLFVQVGGDYSISEPLVKTRSGRIGAFQIRCMVDTENR